jgi:hypothetical protein
MNRELTPKRLSDMVSKVTFKMFFVISTLLRSKIYGKLWSEQNQPHGSFDISFHGIYFNFPGIKAFH